MGLEIVKNIKHQPKLIYSLVALTVNNQALAKLFLLKVSGKLFLNKDWKSKTKDWRLKA